MKTKRVYLCELLSRDDGTRQTCAAFRSKRSAKLWQSMMSAEGSDGFSAADKLDCVPIIKELKVHP